MEIGSIYEIDPKRIKACKAAWEGEPHLKEVQKYGRKHVRYTASGREAAALVLRSLEEQCPGMTKSCLMPAYMCDTLFLPFLRAGWEIIFYHMEKNLRVQETQLRRQVEINQPGLLLIHSYYGVDTWRQMRSFLEECRKKGILVMEDVTQSYYLPEGGVSADYIIGSLRKWYPVPDGGFVVSDRPLTAALWPEDTGHVDKRIGSLTQKWNYLYEAGDSRERQALKSDFLEQNREAEALLDQRTEITALSRCAAGLLMTGQEETCKRRRKENYEMLHRALFGGEGCLSINNRLSHKEEPFIAPVFPELTEGTAPLYFPVYARERDDLQAFLKCRDIYAPVLWPVGSVNQGILSDTDRYIFEHILVLPVDQRYGAIEMERMISVLDEYRVGRSVG